MLFAVLGLAWDAIIPPREARRPWVFVWGRMVRDAATNCLPFSQVGGFVFGARAVTLHGVSWPLATASTVVDVTAEFLAQLAFTAIGLGILLARAPDSSLAVPLEVGLGLAVMAGVALIWLQQGAAPLFARMGRRIAGRWFDDARGPRRGAAGGAVADLRPYRAPGDRLLRASARLARHRRRRLDHLPRAGRAASISTMRWRSRRC